MLLNKKAKVNLKLKDGCTALYAASKNGHEEIVDILLKNNAEVNVKTENGWTALYDGMLFTAYCRKNRLFSFLYLSVSRRPYKDC